MTWFAPGGGVDQELIILLREQVKKYKVTLLVGRDKFHDDFSQIEGLEVKTCPWLVSNFNIVGDFISLIWIYFFITRNKFDLIHTHETKSSLIVRIANFRREAPLIYGLHGVVFNDSRAPIINWLYKKIEKKTVFLADHIVAVGSDVKNTYLLNGIGVKNQWSIIPSGIELKRFCEPRDEKTLQEFRNELGIPKDSFVWINIGRFSASKNQVDTLKAFIEFSKLTEKRTDLIFFGDGPKAEILKNYVQQNKLIDGHVHFAGMRKNISELAKLGNVHLFTSLREGVPRAVIECGLMSIPTISFEVDGIREIINNEISGIIVNSGDTRAMVEQMRILYLHPRKLSQYGKRAKEIAIEGWSSNKMIDSTETLYSRVLGNQGRNKSCQKTIVK
jgi:glycosyltransferase involved in cell wall biosynthesis